MFPQQTRSFCGQVPRVACHIPDRRENDSVEDVSLKGKKVERSLGQHVEGLDDVLGILGVSTLVHVTIFSVS